MALSKQTTVKSVTLHFDVFTVDVQWVDTILEDEVVISETFRRKAYDQSQAGDLADEVDVTFASQVGDMLGWV